MRTSRVGSQQQTRQGGKKKQTFISSHKKKYTNTIALLIAIY
jgi:hypothetical protein